MTAPTMISTAALVAHLRAKIAALDGAVSKARLSVETRDDRRRVLEALISDVEGDVIGDAS